MVLLCQLRRLDLSKPCANVRVEALSLKPSTTSLGTEAFCLPRIGNCISFDKSKGRWQVRLEDRPGAESWLHCTPVASSRCTLTKATPWGRLWRITGSDHDLPKTTSQRGMHLGFEHTTATTDRDDPCMPTPRPDDPESEGAGSGERGLGKGGEEGGSLGVVGKGGVGGEGEPNS